LFPALEQIQHEERAMTLAVKKLEVEDLGQLQSLVMEHLDGIEPGLTVLDARLLLGRASVDVVALDAQGALVLVTTGFTADEEMLLKAVESYSWCLEYPDAIQRLYPSVELSSSRPPRLVFVVERVPDAFHRKIKQLGFCEVDCVEFRHLDVSGTPVAYFETIARLRRGPAVTQMELAPAVRRASEPNRRASEPNRRAPEPIAHDRAIERPHDHTDKVVPFATAPTIARMNAARAAKTLHAAVPSAASTAAPVIDIRAAATPPRSDLQSPRPVSVSNAEVIEAATPAPQIEMPRIESAMPTPGIDEPVELSVPSVDAATPAAPAPALALEPRVELEAPSVAADLAGAVANTPTLNSAASALEAAIREIDVTVVEPITEISLRDTMPMASAAAVAPASPMPEARMLFAQIANELLGNRAASNAGTPKTEPPATARKNATTTITPTPAASTSKLGLPATKPSAPAPRAVPAATPTAPVAQPAPAEAGQTVPQQFEGLKFPNDGVLTRQWMEFLNQMASSNK
jgi:hypothetical protein